MQSIRKGTLNDISQIAEIYEQILTEEEMGRTVIGWQRGVYPTKETALAALKDESLFIMEDDGILVAAARIDQNQVPEYANARWNCPDVPDSQVMVLHTLVVRPDQSGKGYGRAFVRFYEQYALERHCPYLRMDTNAKNAAARRLYAHLGYQEADIVPCVFNGIPGVELVCLEKQLR